MRLTWQDSLVIVPRADDGVRQRVRKSGQGLCGHDVAALDGDNLAGTDSLGGEQPTSGDGAADTLACFRRDPRRVHAHTLTRPWRECRLNNPGMSTPSRAQRA